MLIKTIRDSYCTSSRVLYKKYLLLLTQIANNANRTVKLMNKTINILDIKLKDCEF